MLRFAKSQKSIPLQRSKWARRGQRIQTGKEEGETYQTAAGLRAAAAGVTIAVTPLTGAQVKARG